VAPSSPPPQPARSVIPNPRTQKDTQGLALIKSPKEKFKVKGENVDPYQRVTCKLAVAPVPVYFDPWAEQCVCQASSDANFQRFTA
jgi:hypothetical protein